MKKITLLYMTGMFIVLGCSQPATQNNGMTLQFEGRDINLAPYLQEFPYQQFNVSKDGGKLLFFKTGNENHLQWIDINVDTDLAKATDIVDWNFATRNCWSPTYNAADGYVYWMGDESNNEIINIYRTKPSSNQVDKLTDVPYIYAWGLSPDHKKIAYVARLGQNEHRLDELRVLDLATLSETTVCQDTPEYRFTWGSVCWQPDSKGMTLLALKGMDRTYTNVVYVDANTSKMNVLTDSSREGSLSGCMVLEEWASADECVFISDQDGYNNLYCYSLSTGKTKQITHLNVNIDEAAYVSIGGKRYLLALQSNPIETKMLLIDTATWQVIHEQSSELALRFGTTKENQALLIAGSTTELFQLVRADVNIAEIKLSIVMELDAKLKNKLVHSKVERLEIPSFDIDPLTGKQRILHAYLYVPEHPLPKAKSLVMIESFYGGTNSYSSEYQIWTQAGIYVLSPAPRGSAGFGREFAALNDGDLGGNEIIDIIYCADYISKKLNVPANRIGVFGMSHGGYATMRLMTFPGEVNGNKASFPFGFGIETAGFCDILWQHTHTNIPDWTALEAGDPKKDSLRLVDRSPITHADRITGPLLLIHGNHDNRVDIGGASMMAEKLKELGKPYTYVEFQGLGHGIKGADNNVKFYTECFNFLETCVLKK